VTLDESEIEGAERPRQCSGCPTRRAARLPTRSVPRLADRQELFWQHLLVTWQLTCRHNQHLAGPAKINRTWVTGSLSAAAAEHPNPPADGAVVRLDVALVWKVREDTF
jgi:hypothetical protein